MNRLFRLLRRLLAPPSKRGGVHAVALTADGQIVLVRLTYARGWRLPGGGIEQGESDEEAVLRELREEIGMTGCSRAERAGSHKTGPLFVVRDVLFEPRWSFEVRKVRAFPLDSLPRDTAPVARRMIASARLQ